MKGCFENTIGVKDTALEMLSDITSSTDNLTGVNMQDDAPSDLDVVSWARGEPFSSLKGYAYDASAGLNTYVYIIENGIDPDHPVSHQGFRIRAY